MSFKGTKHFQKRGVALLITLLFIMLITLSVGIGLKQLNEVSHHMKAENFLFQTSAILDDALRLLQNSQELNAINSSEEFSVFLSEAAFIPFEASGIKVSLELNSARSKFNVNSLMDLNNSIDHDRVNSLKEYMSNYMVNIGFVDVLLDSMGGIKEDMSYNSDLFNEKSRLFRDYIISDKHFDELSDFYLNYYRDNSLKNIDFKELFYFSNNRSHKVDLNYATAEVWEMMLGCDKLKATELSKSSYNSFESIGLSDEELDSVKKKFDTSFFEPYLDVVIKVEQGEHNARIRFEYDIKKREGSNFVYDI